MRKNKKTVENNKKEIVNVMLNLYIGYCQKLYTQHCHFLYIVNLLITLEGILRKESVKERDKLSELQALFPDISRDLEKTGFTLHLLWCKYTLHSRTLITRRRHLEVAHPYP